MVTGHEGVEGTRRTKRFSQLWQLRSKRGLADADEAVAGQE